MDNKDLDNKTPEELYNKIAETRAALNDKTEALKFKVAKMNAQFKKAKRSLSLSHQIVRHPWHAMAGAIGTGIIITLILRSNKKSVSTKSKDISKSQKSLNGYDNIGHSNFEDQKADHRADSSILSRFATEFANEIRIGKNLAIGSGIALFSEMVKRNLPSILSPHIDEIAAQVSNKRGVKVVQLGKKSNLTPREEKKFNDEGGDNLRKRQYEQ